LKFGGRVLVRILGDHREDVMHLDLTVA